MYLIVIAWLYVVVMMALAEALSSQGTVLGAVFTLLLYGLLPLSLLLYILGTPARKRALKRREAEADAASRANAPSADDGDGRGHAAGGAAAAIPPEGKEP